MSTIEIHNLKVDASHGVSQEEKTYRQPFLFDIILEYDFEKAARLDDISLTLNYSTIMHDVNDFCQNNTFNLIETLCVKTATMLMRKYNMQTITVTVKKPQAPVTLTFNDVAVTTTLTRTPVILSLGSNLGDRQKYLDTAIKRLSDHPDIVVQKVSSPFENPPYGGVAKQPFINEAAMISTYLSSYELLDYLHMIENEALRDRSEHWGDRTLDMDIIFYGSTVINSEALTIPHPDYQNRDFVIKPIKEIAPNFIDPIYKKRIADM